jgi:4-amino-4-deoxy-L-arabinose transferase-like glycosyltransferase
MSTTEPDSQLAATLPSGRGSAAAVTATGPQRSRRVTLALCLGLFLLALVPRVLDPGRPVTWDEPKWVNRSLRFAKALEEGELKKTFQVGHPGVTTMWLAGLGMTAYCQVAPPACAGVPLLSAGTSGIYASEAALKTLPGVLPAARLPIALAVAAAVVALFLLARRIVDPRAALAGAVLIAVDPFFIAHSRVVQLDALTATFMCLSLLALLVGLALPRRRFVAASAVCAGLAVLSKSSALFIGPFAGLVVLAWALRAPPPRRAAWVLALGTYAAWVAVVAATAFAFWPALWVNARETLRQVLEMGSGYAQAPHENQSFFLGRVVDDPGPAFYPVAVAFRLTPLTTVGLLALALGGLGLAIWAARRRRWAVTRQGWAVLAMAAYVVLFAAFMTVGAKKFDRYLLSVFPVLDLLAAVGLVWSAARAGDCLAARRRSLALAPMATVAVLVTAQALAVLAYHPEYLAYYNPLLGGGARAATTVLVGWGEGMDLVADYLNRQPDAANRTAVAWVEPGFTPLFRGHTMDFQSFTSLAQPDYVVFYVSDVQRRLHQSAHAVFDPLEPELVVRLHGIEYARVYRNDHGQALRAYLAGRAGPGDALLLSQASVLQRDAAVGLPMLVAPPPGQEDGTALQSALTQLAGQHPRLWYVDYGGTCDADGHQRFAVATSGPTFGRHVLQPYGVTVTGVRPTRVPSATVVALPIGETRFGDQIRLDGLGVGPDRVAAGGSVGVTASWQALTGGLPPLAAKLVLRDAAGHLVGTGEQQLVDEQCQPTTTWQSGTSDRDWYLLNVPPGTPPGTYSAFLVVYNQDTGAALPVVTAGGSGGSELALGPLTVERPEAPPDVADLGIQQPLDAPPIAGLRLLGYTMSEQPITAGDQRQLALYWQAERDIGADLDVRVRWQDAAGRTWHESRLPNAAYPTSRWLAGDVLRVGYDLQVDEAAPDGPATLVVDLAPAGGGPPVPGAGIRLTTLPVQALARRFEVPADMAQRQDARLGDGVRLLGYSLAPERVAPGASLDVRLYWQARQQMDRNYTVFVHLLDDSGRIVAQADGQPVAGQRPTRGWTAGEVLTDSHTLALPGDAASGRYRLEVGMYDQATGDRLAVTDAAGTSIPANRVLLGTPVIVSPP